ncbi:hypothetical protein [Lusitaniella coriacea]
MLAPWFDLFLNLYGIGGCRNRFNGLMPIFRDRSNLQEYAEKRDRAVLKD